MNGYFRFFGYLLVAAVLWSCAERKEPSRSGDIPIISWAGIPADRSAVLFPLLKECGIDWHLGLYRDSGEACAALEEAEKAGVGLIPGFPALKDSTENAVAVLKDSPALVAYHLEDEPELSDIPWLAALVVKIRSLDSAHPPYVNLYPDWAWGQDSYRDNIEEFAANVNVPFYSFDQYPVTEKDGRILGFCPDRITSSRSTVASCVLSCPRYRPAETSGVQRFVVRGSGHTIFYIQGNVRHPYI